MLHFRTKEINNEINERKQKHIDSYRMSNYYLNGDLHRWVIFGFKVKRGIIGEVE